MKTVCILLLCAVPGMPATISLFSQAQCFGMASAATGVSSGIVPASASTFNFFSSVSLSVAVHSGSCGTLSLPAATSGENWMIAGRTGTGFLTLSIDEVDGGDNPPPSHVDIVMSGNCFSSSVLSCPFTFGVPFSLWLVFSGFQGGPYTVASDAPYGGWTQRWGTIRITDESLRVVNDVTIVHNPEPSGLVLITLAIAAAGCWIGWSRKGV